MAEKINEKEISTYLCGITAAGTGYNIDLESGKMMRMPGQGDGIPKLITPRENSDNSTLMGFLYHKIKKYNTPIKHVTTAQILTPEGEMFNSSQIIFNGKGIENLLDMDDFKMEIETVNGSIVEISPGNNDYIISYKGNENSIDLHTTAFYFEKESMDSKDIILKCSCYTSSEKLELGKILIEKGMYYKEEKSFKTSKIKSIKVSKKQQNNFLTSIF